MTTERPAATPSPDPAGPGTAPSADDRQWGMLAHISSLIAIAVGGLMVLGPLIVWLMKKDQSEFVAHHAREALNFQIMWLIVLAVLFVAGFVTCMVGWFVMPVAGVVNIVFTIIAAMKANAGERYRYPFSIRLVS